MLIAPDFLNVFYLSAHWRYFNHIHCVLNRFASSCYYISMVQLNALLNALAFQFKYNMSSNAGRCKIMRTHASLIDFENYLLNLWPSREINWYITREGYTCTQPNRNHQIYNYKLKFSSEYHPRSTTNNLITNRGKKKNYQVNAEYEQMCKVESGIISQIVFIVIFVELHFRFNAMTTSHPSNIRTNVYLRSFYISYFFFVIHNQDKQAHGPKIVIVLWMHCKTINRIGNLRKPFGLFEDYPPST